MDSLQQEIRDIQQKCPNYSSDDIVKELARRGWHLESDARLSFDKPSTPNWFQLIAHSVNSETAKKSRPHHQIIPNGQFRIIEQVADQDLLERMRLIADHQFAIPGQPPVAINQIKSSESRLFQESILSLSRKVLLELGVDQHDLDSGVYSLLMNRCVLRRTYSPGQWLEEYRNRNNQHWHQDSNVLFGSLPMLTIWISLHDGAGVSRPSLEVSTLSVPEFSSTYGDSTPQIEDIAKAYALANHIETVPAFSLGSALVFNGLTFHRTFVSEGMTGHRDALLIRLCRTCNRHLFPGDRSYDCVV